MANLKEIRTRITSVKSTRQITAAMKMISAARLRKAQDLIVRLRPYAAKLREIMAQVSSVAGESDAGTPFARVTAPGRVLLVVITSKRGLCGAFNTNVIRESVRVANEIYPEQRREGALEILAIGRKGHDYLKKRDYTIFADKSDIFDNLSFESVSDLAGEIMERFVNGEFDRVEFVYNRFRNAAVQDLIYEPFLPVTAPDEVEADLVTDYILEPDIAGIIRELIPRSLKIQFYQTILNSWVAEHGARMTSMHMATDNATSLISSLTLEYNKARQASITNQILEVVSGAEALKG
ncbi:MAG: ATP synthase F1 subunit gamma [Bacteroidales bacterium]|nr:ATP synthase F1 subunit gamma [Bacteroidales bacterium]